MKNECPKNLPAYNSGNDTCFGIFDFSFPDYTIFCHPDDERYFKERIKEGVNILTTTYLLRNQFIKSKDLHVEYTEPEIGLEADDYANDKFTVRCQIKSVERM